MQSLVLTIRCRYVYGRSWIIGSMSTESPTVGIWNTCKVCTETLRDTLSSGTNLSSISAMLTDLQTHETPEGFLTCPVYLYNLGLALADSPIVTPCPVQNIYLILEKLEIT